MRQQRNTASFRPSPGRGGLLQGRGLGVGGQAGFHPGWSTLHTATSAWPLDLGPRHSHGARPLAWRLQEDNGAHENVHITPTTHLHAYTLYSTSGSFWDFLHQAI